MKILRILFWYVAYLLVSSFFSGTFLKSWSEGARALFVFVAPVAAVWWSFRKREERKGAVEVSDERRDRSRHQGGSLESGFSDASYIPRAGEAPLLSRRELTPIQSFAEARKPETSQPVQERTLAVFAPPQGWELAGTQKFAPHQGKIRQGWIPKGQSVSVAGREIGGMIYIGASSSGGSYGTSASPRAFIDPSLKVSAIGGDQSGDTMPYWPGYSGISAVCRASYLDWLAGGRSDLSYGVGYVFLYFYGLERRFLQDQSAPEERREILEETERLLALYGGNGSVRGYLGEFIQIARLSLNDARAMQPSFDAPRRDAPLSVKFNIGGRIGAGEALTWDWALNWLLCHPEHRLRTPATRCPEEFQALFKLGFERRFPEGMKIPKPRKSLKGVYRAASSEFQVEMMPLFNGRPVPDISDLSKPIEAAQEIADEAMGALEKFSRFLGRNPEGRGGLEARALLPPELWDLFPSEELESLRAWAQARVAAGGLTPVVDVVERLEGARPDSISKRQLTDAADALARIGFGLAPDARYALRSPKFGETVVIFELGAPMENLEDVSSAYRAALLELALGVSIAHADGQVTEDEKTALRRQAEQKLGLSEGERRRLAANLDWLIATPLDMALLRRKMKAMEPERQAAVRAAMVSVAHADRNVGPAEVREIERIYKNLGFNPELVYADLHAGNGADAPVSVRAAESGAAGEPIPALPALPESTSSPARLDAARIAAIRRDTALASSVLGEVFVGEQEEDSPGEDEAPSVLNGLDPKHADLLKALLDRDRWSEAEFSDLAKDAGLMASGALETLNEWAFSRYEEALLDEYDGYDLAPDVAGALRSALQEEMR